MQDLKRFVSEEACLSCDGCCRYASQQTVWAPVFLFDEIVALIDEDIVPSALFTHANLRGHEAARVNLVPSRNTTADYICPCFDLTSHQCKIYLHRPFDCRLYPFLLEKKDDEIILCCDKKCPFVKKALQTAQTENYIRYLSDFFSREDVLAWAQKNPAIVQDYPAEDLEFLRSLPSLTHCLYGFPSTRP